jgi:hypothetical protein
MPRRRYSRATSPPGPLDEGRPGAAAAQRYRCNVKIAADLTRDLELDSPVVQLVSARFEQARDALGYGADNSEAIKAWRK